MKKLTSKTEKLLNDFEEAVSNMASFEEGYNHEEFEDLEEIYNKSKEILVNRLWYLEKKIKHLQAKNF